MILCILNILKIKAASQAHSMAKRIILNKRLIKNRVLNAFGNLSPIKSMNLDLKDVMIFQQEI